MSIIRTSHNKENPYVILNKTCLEDTEISWAAKGLWSYLMSRPDDWHISVSHLSTIYEKKGGGEKAIYSLLNEMIECGYCERIKCKEENGRFSRTEYKITEFKIKVPHLPQRDAAERRAVEVPPTNKGVILCNENTTTTTTTTNGIDSAAAAVSCVEEKKFSEDLRIRSFLNGAVNLWGKNWDIPLHVIQFLIHAHGERYVSEQFAYMIKKHNQALNDEENPRKKRKGDRIEKPESYLKLACEKNYASSTNKKGHDINGSHKVLKI